MSLTSSSQRTSRSPAPGTRVPNATSSWGKTKGNESYQRSQPYQAKGSPKGNQYSNPKSDTDHVTVCRDYQNGNCKRESCRFAHVCEKCGKKNCWPKKGSCTAKS